RDGEDRHDRLCRPTCASGAQYPGLGRDRDPQGHGQDDRIVSMYTDGVMAKRLNAVLIALAGAAFSIAASAGTLENPQPGGRESGIGIVSGWFCNANRIDVEIDGATPLKAAYGTQRADTQAPCGRTDTGFALL